MSKFYLYRREHGEGCDYTIGCGEELSPLDATTEDAAYVEALSSLAELYDCANADEILLKQCLVLEQKFDLAEVLRGMREKAIIAEREATLAAKREQLAALKKELGE